jgi:hypothetical protein
MFHGAELEAGDYVMARIIERDRRQLKGEWWR